MLFDRTASLILLVVAILSVQTIGCRRGDMGDLLGVGMLTADLSDTDVTCLAGLGEGVVTTVKVFALLQDVVSTRPE